MNTVTTSDQLEELTPSELAQVEGGIIAVLIAAVGPNIGHDSVP